MGESILFQPLTKEDKISVVLYRAGIAMSSVIISIIALLMVLNVPSHQNKSIGILFNAGLIALYISVGLSVFFIHLYVSRFHKNLKRLYYVSVIALIILFIAGRGDISGAILSRPYGPLLLIPLSFCLGFITAKEAFCFRLKEGYALALIMPVYLLLLSGGMTASSASYGLLLIALMLLFFTARKIFMPMHYDIGNKSAYC